MTVHPMTCPGCDHHLTQEDRFCSRCGTPMAPDPEATVVDAVPAPAADSSGNASEAPAVVEEPRPASRPSGYTDTLRHVLGGEFELLGAIGQGGFARVYRARDRRLDRIVAIKVIRPDLAGATMFVDSFRSEGIALAKLRHPGIVPIYDIREREGLIYYVMPFVQGETIAGKLRRLRRIPPAESHRILVELCDALAAAHRAKMVHRDIKPENVILEGTLQKALLMDFGIAKPLTEEIEDSSGDPIIGTPVYMSPEQVAGRDDIDHRSDLYSLGVMAYHMLAGRPPFIGTAGEIREKHVKEKPVPIRDRIPSLPKSFADAIMRCLEKDPWDRFSTAGDLWSALQSASFVSTSTDTHPTASSAGVSTGTSTTKAVLLAVLGAIAGFLGGRAVAGSGPALPPSGVAAEAVVSEWLSNPAGGAATAFEPGATVMHLPVDAEESMTVELSPTDLPQDRAVTTRVADVADRPLDVRTFWDLAVVTGSYGPAQRACGKAWFVLRAHDGEWRMVHVRLQDLEARCEP